MRNRAAFYKVPTEFRSRGLEDLAPDAYFCGMAKDALQNLDVGSFEILEPAEGKRRRRFRMVANTGAPVSRMFGKAVFDLAGIEMAKKIPILADHDSKLRAGFADKAELTDEGLVLSGVLLSNDTGKQIAAESDEGFPFQASVGLQVSQWLEVEAGDTLEVNGREVTGPISVAVKSRLLESSFLMAGADSKTSSVVLSKEALMTPDAFLAANPEAVAAWKNEAADAARKAQREELGAYLAAFPGREAWAQQRFVAGDSLLEAKAALSDVLQEELTAVKDAPPAKPTKAETDAKTLEALAARAPGVGFNGQVAEKTAPTTQTLWQDPKIQAEFGGSHTAYLQSVNRGLIEELNG